MNEQAVNPKPRWRRILRKLFIGVGIFVAVIIVGLAIWNFIAARQLKNEIAKIHAAGEPITLADLEAQFPKVPEADNAVRFYLAGLELLVNKDEIGNLHGNRCCGKQCPTTVPATRLSTSELEKAQTLLSANQPALDLFDQGTQLPAVRSELWIKNGMQFQLGRLSDVRGGIRLLSLRTRVLASTDKPDEAVDSAIAALRFTRILDDQPLLTSYLVKIGVTAVIYHDIQTILDTNQPTEQALIKLQNALSDMAIPSLKQIFLTERVYGNEIMFPIATSSNLPEHLPDKMKKSPFMKQTAVGYLRGMTEFINAAEKPWPEIFPAIQQVQTTGFFGKLLLSPYKRIAVMYGRALAGKAATEIAVMIERYRLAHGQLPESLDQLAAEFTAELPNDPFTGKAMIYHHDDAGYRIYSVGDNLKDDGGTVLYRSVPNADWGIRVAR